MFQGNPRIRYIPRGERVGDDRDLLFELCDPLIYDAVIDGRRICGEVPVGFRTDFASVPRFFWRIFPPLDDWWRAAILHDWLLERSELSKEMCDATFCEGLRADGVKPWRRVLMVLAVRYFGGRTRR